MNIRPGDLKMAVVFGTLLIVLGLVVRTAEQRDEYYQSLTCSDGEVLVRSYPHDLPLCVAARTPGRRTAP